MSHHQIVHSLNRFSFAFYERLSQAEEHNLFFSPYSLFYALAILYTGAQGVTKQQMGKALYLDSALENKNDLAILNLTHDPKKYVLFSHTAFWFNRDIQVKDTFRRYIGSLGIYDRFLDFSQPDACLRIINGWVKECTKGKIDQLVKKEFLSADARFILTNAIYFKAFWEERFRKDLTYPETFHGMHGDRKTEMMYDTDYFEFARMDGVKILKLFFENNEASALFFLPDDADDVKLESVKKLLTKRTLSEIESHLATVKVILQLPKMRMEMECQAEGLLKDMGMDIPFLNEADFSGIADEPLKISKVVQKAYFNLDEDGCEAAAATAVEVLAGALAIPEKIEEFICDHPFAFLLKDEAKGAILFMGELKE